MNTSIGTSRGNPTARMLVGQSHAPVDFHGARVGALHLRQEQRRLLLLDQDAAHAAHAEIDRKREARRSGAGNDDLGIHAQCIIFPPSTSSVWPVMKSLAGEDRNITAPTRSSGTCTRSMARPDERAAR